jgi:phosphoenolpyruvate synthase/pyruvate phosphate dikinase
MAAYVFAFGGGATNDDPRSRDKTIVGGKGANLAEMAGIGLPVPPGFTITTEECVRYLAEGGEFSDALKADVAAALGHIERRWQDIRRSGRSAARLGPLRRARFDAGDDGHRAQPRPQ